MPHLTLEYSDNLPYPVEIQGVLKTLHEGLLPMGPFEISQIKSRAVAHKAFRVGVGEPDSVFIHLTVSVLTGRDLEKRQEIGQRLLELLQQAFAKTFAERPCDITVDVREMQRETYCKAMNEAAKRVGKG